MSAANMLVSLVVILVISPTVAIVWRKRMLRRRDETPADRYRRAAHEDTATIASRRRRSGVRFRSNRRVYVAEARRATDQATRRGTSPRLDPSASAEFRAYPRCHVVAQDLYRLQHRLRSRVGRDSECH